MDPEEGPGYGVESTVFHLQPAAAGPYVITIISDATTNYELVLLAHNSAFQDVSATTTPLRSSIMAGIAQKLRITFDPVSGNRLIFKPDIDISNLTSRTMGACLGAVLTGNSEIIGAVTINGSLVMSGNSKIMGDTTAFPINQSGNAKIAGTIVQSSSSLNCFPIDMSFTQQALEASNDNAAIPAGFLSGGILGVTGSNTLSLPEGNYIVDRLEVSGNAKLRASGAVNLFVRKSVSLSGNSETGTSSAPINILVGSGSDQVLSGKSIRAIFYAPTAKAILSGNTLFSGRLHAGRIEMAGTSKVEAP